MTISEETMRARRLFSARLEAKLKEYDIKQNELAKILNISESTVGKWILGKSMPRTMGLIQQIADYFHVGKSYFLEESPSPRPSKQDATPLPPADGLPVIPIDDRNFRVPVVGRVAAGQPIVADEEIIGYEYIDNKYSKDGHEYFGLRIVGKSMEPTIMDGDIVIVRRQDYVENGEIAIVLIDGEEATAKEVKESPEGITLIGHNAAVYTPHFYSAREVQDLPVQVIGRVVQLVRRF